MKGLVLVIAVGVASAALAATRGTAAPEPELWALRYGESRYPSRYIFLRDTKNADIPFHWLFYAIKRGNRVILVDTGIADQKTAAAFDATWEDPVAVLASIGIATTDVTDVVITHRHVDHAGNLHRFPRAVLYIQNDERAALLAAASTSEAVRKRLKAKNVVAFDDAAAVADILTVRKIGGHTAGSCVVYLHAFDAACVLTGDECYLPANVTERNPVGTLVNEKANVAFIEDLYASGTRFFTFHDPALVPGPQKARRLL